MLSKKQFNKLSPNDQKRLLRSLEQESLKRNSSRSSNARKKSSKGTPAIRKQASVAAAYATGTVGKAPVVRQNGRDSCRIAHRELISSVTGSIAFTVAESFAINPGISATFPWLSIVAQAWEQYEFHSLKFCYYTRTGSNTPGSYMMAPDYDAADAAPATEQIASTYEDAVEDAPWKDSMCILRKMHMSDFSKRRFVRTEPLAANLDIKTYDVGNLHSITIDGTAVSWGKLWVEYDISFFLPQLNPAGICPFGGFITGATTQTGANPFGTAPIVTAGARGIAIDGASTITFSSLGDYALWYELDGTTIVGPVINNGAGVSVTASSCINAAATRASIYLTLQVSSLVGATIEVTIGAATITDATVAVAQAPTGSLP